MISIVGYIKVQETEERIAYLVSCLRSFAFLKNRCQIILCLDRPSEKLYDLVKEELKEYNYKIVNLISEFDYGSVYMELLEACDHDYILNFIEDHFMLCDDADYMQGLIDTMKESHIDVCKASFHEIERKSAMAVWGKDSNEYGEWFVNNESNHEAYERNYGQRFFIGVNFITSLPFAKLFWNRSLGKTPHPYEMAKHQPGWTHKVIVPVKELLCACDDPHGEFNSDLMSRNEPKFNEIYGQVKDYIGRTWTVDANRV